MLEEIQSESVSRLCKMKGCRNSQLEVDFNRWPTILGRRWTSKQTLIQVSNSVNPGIHLPLMASHASSIPGKPSDLNRAPTNGTTQETYYTGPDVAWRRSELHRNGSSGSVHSTLGMNSCSHTDPSMPELEDALVLQVPAHSAIPRSDRASSNTSLGYS